MKRTISVLLMRDETGPWEAQCLEHDIASQGETINGALVELMHIFCAKLVDNGTLEGIPPAPKRYWDKYCDAMVLEHSKQPTFQPEIECQSGDVSFAHMLPKFREIRVV